MKRWKPKMDETFFMIKMSTRILVDNFLWTGGEADKELYELGNLYKTEKEALKKVESIKKLLREGKE